MKIPIALTALAAAGFAQVSPSTMPRVGSVDERFQSFNIEMVEVTGGRFWRPYSEIGKILDKPTAGGPVGLDPNLYMERPPINLANLRLRKLAAALGPAYLRVSGTWANSTYFGEAPKPPEGFGGVLTLAQWKGVVDFSRAVDAKIVTSVATGAGVRDSSGLWTPAQAQAFFDYTRSIGGGIAAAEFMNEPSFASMGGAPAGYDAAAYGRDLAVFNAFMKTSAPETKILGPGSVGEGVMLGPPELASRMIKSDDLLAKGGADFDAFSYHFYGAVSKRCGIMGAAGQTTPDAALTPEWLTRTDRVEAFYAALRDKFAPGKPMWLSETGDAACGGNPWGATFLDSFRYLHQLGSLAKRGVIVVTHNTLAASDYGLIDEKTLAPRPNYWSALVWRRLMGPTVLDAGAQPSENLYLYAHCLRGKPGGVALLAINADRAATATLHVALKAERYTLTARNLEDSRVQLNSKDLQLAGDDIPALKGAPEEAGALKLAPASITFLAIPSANNPSCK
ncbi:MAG TPA: hypothetical protein VMT15_18110 [Bryobacteraceae bacterium]|nr:hypothetical protein [Bryobacteraceae bacterium]